MRVCGAGRAAARATCRDGGPAGVRQRAGRWRAVGRYDHCVSDCLFCGIASGRFPAKTVRENSRTIAFRDINPQAPTHVLVIPKEHYADVAAVAEAGGGLLDEMASLAHRVAVAEGIGGSGYRADFNSGPDAGQDVAHAHVIGGRPLEWPPG